MLGKAGLPYNSFYRFGESTITGITRPPVRD